MTTMELRPLSTGELLDRTFSYYREHFLLFVGIMALPQVVIVAVSLVLQSFRLMSMGAPAPQIPSEMGARIVGFMTGFLITMTVMGLVFILIYSVVLGATTVALSEVYLGRSTSIAVAYGILRGKVWRLFDLVISITLRVVGLYVVFMLAGIVIAILPAGLLGAFGGKNPIIMIIAGLLVFVAFIGGLICATVLTMRYALAVPALILENLRARDALKRSVTLAKGNLWRIFLIILLMQIIGLAVAAIFQGPFWLAMFIIGAKAGMLPFWLQVPMTISGGIGGALSGPLLVIALALLYYDARVRKEGFDLQMMMPNLNDGAVGEVSSPAITPAVPSAF